MHQVTYGYLEGYGNSPPGICNLLLTIRVVETINRKAPVLQVINFTHERTR
jgi:hypothetical protein